MKDILEAMDQKIDRLEKQIKEVDETNIKASIKSKIADLESQGKTKPVMQIKKWVESGVRDYAIFEKGLALDGNTALYEAELNTDILEQAISNTAVLGAIGKRGTKNLDYRRTILTQRPGVQLTGENTGFSDIVETDASAYSSISADFTKIFSYPFLTRESISFGDVGVQANLLKLMAEDFSITIQNQILQGTGLGAGTKADPKNLKGICFAAIDRANSYTEALKPASTRARDIFAAVASGDAIGIGTDSNAIEANLYKLMLTVPERSQATSQFLMHPNTLSHLMRTLKDTQGRSLIKIELIENNGVWLRRINLFGANIILSDVMDEIGANNAAIVFGDFKAGYELLQPDQGSHMIQDPYTIPDTVRFYSDQWVGSIVADHQALAVLVCV